MDLQNQELVQKAKQIKAILFDVDGVLTDGGIIYEAVKGRQGKTISELKRFNVKDGLILAHLKRYGFKVGAITGRSSEVVQHRCEELNLDFCIQGTSNKLEKYQNFKEQFQIQDQEIAYLGDDLIDLPILVRCGLAICPADAREYIKRYVHFCTPSRGGDGVLRDAADFILASQGLLEELIATFAQKTP